MKFKLPGLALAVIFIFTASNLFSQDFPSIGFVDLMEQSEEDYSMVTEARQLTAQLNIPHTIYLPEGIFIEARGIENSRVVYAVMNDIVDIYNGAETLFWEEIVSRYDLSNARQHFLNHNTINPNVGFPDRTGEINEADGFAATYLICPESTGDEVMSFNPETGALINAGFVPSDPTNLSTPINAILSPNITILVSDQINDHLAAYDTMGTFLNIFYGGNVAVLDNIRGISNSPDLSSVLVSVGGGTNQDAIAQFDLAGIYLGNFITPNATNMDSPFDVTFRTSDVLVPASTSDNVARYDLAGTFLDNFALINFPEQVNETSTGNVLVAGFSSPSGLYVFDAAGTQLNYFSAVTGLRGAYLLGNGNYLVTNGSGVHEIDGTTGALIETEIAGVSARFIEPFDVSAVPVELSAFSASVSGVDVTLNWTTATETNNRGFDIERSTSGSEFSKVGYVAGFGTSTETHSYSFIDGSLANGSYTYRLKQIDYNGAFEYSNEVQVEVTVPDVFSLEQNYPNPFNPGTTIKFSLAVDSKVTLTVFNVLGEEIANLINSNLSAGVNQINFDASNLNSGVYFYRIDAAGIDGTNFSSIKKMILTK